MKKLNPDRLIQSCAAFSSALSIFHLFRSLILFALRQFFSVIIVRGSAVERGAAVVVGNHQNLALDSLVISSAYRRPLWYLGKSTLFKNPIRGWLLRALHVAPLYRKQDDPSQMGKNAETFKAVASILQRGRAVLLFPEGVSLGERTLQPIKTGAARMAFQAEEESGFCTGVVVQPAGLTYGDLTLFRSSVTVVLGEAISVAQFKSLWDHDQKAAVQALTDSIEEGLRKVSVEIANREHVRLVEKIAKLYRRRRSGVDDFERLSLIARNVEEVGASRPELKLEIERELDRFNELCSLFYFGNEDPVAPLGKGRVFLALLLSPLIGLGVMLFLPPYRLIGWVVRQKFDHPVYFASAKFLLGLVLFPIWVAIIAIVALILTTSPIIAVVVAILSVLAALAANNYLADLRAFVFLRLWPGSRKPSKFLLAEQERLVARLEGVRKA